MCLLGIIKATPGIFFRILINETTNMKNSFALLPRVSFKGSVHPTLLVARGYKS